MSRFYFTFGVTGKHPNCYTVIEAETHFKAREIMFARYGSEWCTSFSERAWYMRPTDLDWQKKCKKYGIPIDRKEPISFAEICGMKEIKQTNNKYMKAFEQGFRRGFGQLRIDQKKEAQQKIMDALGTSSVANFYMYKNGGKPNITAVQAQSVEQVFEYYGITDVWGA